MFAPDDGPNLLNGGLTEPEPKCPVPKVANCWPMGMDWSGAASDMSLEAVAMWRSRGLSWPAFWLIAADLLRGWGFDVFEGGG